MNTYCSQLGRLARVILVGTAAIYLSSIHSLLAQAKSGPAPAVVAVKPPNDADAWSRRIDKIALDGIPLGEVAKLLRDKFPEINFIVVGDANSHQVFCDLRAVTLEDIMKAITLAANGALVINREDERMVSFRMAVAPPPPPVKAAPICQVFNLSRYLEGKSDEDIDKALTSLHEAVAVSMKLLDRQYAEAGLKAAPAPEMTIHRETKLLIVVGKPGPGFDAVNQVVNALQGKPFPLTGGYGTGYGGAPPGLTLGAPAPVPPPSAPPKPKPPTPLR